MNISLPQPLKQFVDEQVRDGGFSSTSDYVRELIRERQRQAAVNHLRALIAEGLASGPTVPVDKAWFAKMRRRARARKHPSAWAWRSTGGRPRCAMPSNCPRITRVKAARRWSSDFSRNWKPRPGCCPRIRKAGRPGTLTCCGNCPRGCGFTP